MYARLCTLRLAVRFLNILQLMVHLSASRRSPQRLLTLSADGHGTACWGQRLPMFTHSGSHPCNLAPSQPFEIAYSHPRDLAISRLHTRPAPPTLAHALKHSLAPSRSRTLVSWHTHVLASLGARAHSRDLVPPQPRNFAAARRAQWRGNAGAVQPLALNGGAMLGWCDLWR